MKKDMKGYRELTGKLYTAPKCVQELIPVYRIARDGIFELEKKPEGTDRLFDKAYLFLDTNFATMDDYEQEEFLKLYTRTLNSLNVSFKICIMNNNRNMETVRREIFLKQTDGRFAEMVASFNRHMEDSMLKGRSGIDQARLFVLTCKRKTAEQARDYFRSVEASLAVNFNRMKSGLIPLDATDRLKYLHAFYRLGEETRFDFDFDSAFRRRADWRDFIAPYAVKHYQDEYGTFDGITLQLDQKYVRAFYLPQFPNSINPGIIQKLTSGPYHVILTADVAAVPQDVTRKRLMDLYMQNGRIIEKQQQARNKAMAWSSDITYERRREREELESYLDVVNENDEKMFYVGLYAVLTAGSKEELENAVVSFTGTAEGEGFTFKPAIWEQLEVVNTALPVGARFCSVMQPLFTQALCAITPFVVHELYEPGGIFYGINQVSKNLLVGDRKKLRNGNGFILGVTGGGKGMDAKQEMLQVFLNTDDDIIVIDPQNEYKEIAGYLGGQFIDFGADSGHYVNPLDLDNLQYMETKRAFITDKTELMLGIFSQISGNEVTPQDKSIIGRCVNLVYKDLEAKRKKNPPTLGDLYEVLRQQPEEQAYQIGLALELFVTGSLDMFAKQTNVNTKSRVTFYGIADLGREQSAVGMMIMLEGIRSRIAANAKRGKATWLYIDEFHNLAIQEYPSRFFEKIWKEVRKLGGLCTAMTQNIADVIGNKVVETMLCNSEYLSLLNQSDIEIDLLSRILGISDNLLQYVRNAERGCGLLKFGDKYIPKDARVPKDSEMYRLFNTNFHELQKLRKKDAKKQLAALPDEVRSVIRNEPTEGEKIYP